MSKIFDIDFRKGGLIDSVSKTAGTLTIGNGGFKETEKGKAMLFDGATSKLVFGNIGNVKSIVFFAKLKTTTEQIFEGAANDKLIHNNAGTLTYTDFDNAFIDNVDTDILDTNWHCIIVTSSTDVDCSAATLTLNNTDYGNLYCAKVTCYDTELTAQERTNIYTEFLHSFNLAIQKVNPIDYNVNKPIDLSNETGLVAAYNMTPQNGELVDISGNGNTGTISGALSTKDGMKFDGIADKIVLGNIGNVKSIVFRIKLSTTTEQILEGAANDKLIHINAGTLTYSDYDNAYIDGVDSNTMIASQWHNIVITSSTDIDNSAVTLALNNVSYGAFEIADLKFYNTELTLQEAKDYHNSFAKQVTLYEDFRYDNADGSNLTPLSWNIGTGGYKIGELTSQDSVLKDLGIGTKYLENTSAGTIAIQQEEAYGTWEFDVYKRLDSNVFNIFCISDNTSAPFDGYYLQLTKDEEIRFFRRDGGSADTLLLTDESYFQNSTRYRIKVTRTTDGEFTVYIKGGSFGNIYTLVDVTGGSGTNPVTDNTYTTSKYFVIDLDVGDRISRIKKLKGVEV